VVVEEPIKTRKSTEATTNPRAVEKRAEDNSEISKTAEISYKLIPAKPRTPREDPKTNPADTSPNSSKKVKSLAK